MMRAAPLNSSTMSVFISWSTSTEVRHPGFATSRDFREKEVNEENRIFANPFRSSLCFIHSISSQCNSTDTMMTTNNVATTSHHCCCSVCGKKESGTTKLLICSKCSSPSYLLCGTTCQRMDWKRHKRTECSSAVLRMEDGLPTDPCACTICADDGTKGEEDEEDIVSDFFNDLHMVRGSKDCYKFIHDVTWIWRMIISFHLTRSRGIITTEETMI